MWHADRFDSDSEIGRLFVWEDGKGRGLLLVIREEERERNGQGKMLDRNREPRDPGKTLYIPFLVSNEIKFP